MAVVASRSDEEAIARWDGEGGSPAARSTVRVRDRAAERFVRFVGLTGVVEVRDGDVSFPLGVLWPYTGDLRRVRDAFEDGGEVPTGALLTALTMLYERIAFVPGRAGSEVADACRVTRKAIGAGGGDAKPTRRCSRCREEFSAPGGSRGGVPGGWWLCPPCHDKLIGRGPRSVS
jgi:hypothetical protein